MNANEEYRFFLERYLLPLLGVPAGKAKVESVNEIDRVNTFNVFRSGEYIVFLADRVPYYRTKISVSNDNLRLARNILRSFLQVSRFKLLEKGTDIQHEYLSDTLQIKSYEYAIQHGISTWITGTTRISAVDHLLNLLERWSVQTYEGKKVTFGFVVNSKREGSIDWLEFLEDDYSATLTDCIHSVIELDGEGRLIEYHSLTQDGSKHSNDHGIRPFRFSDVLVNYVTNDKVGVFLLNNGDIIISKAKQIKFVKRNLNWLNMSYESFANAIQSVQLDETIQKEIYASMLDVSFAHTGGIIAVVNNVQILRNEKILSPSDDITNSGNIRNLLDGIGERDIEKRLLKRQSILALVGEASFGEVDRKLRAELIAMDGACIIGFEGQLYAIGAIIQNESGSSGGGRAAACKRLSRYGIAIKISTDGYIELFQDGEMIYCVK